VVGLAVLVVIATLGCVRRYDVPPPPEAVWLFFEPGDPEKVGLRCGVEPRWEGGIEGLMPLYYDSKDEVAICGTRLRPRGFAYPGYAKDELVGYLRGKAEVRGTGDARQPGVWVRFHRIGTRAGDPRVAAAIERSEQRFGPSNESK
jgi:hypothetical protein